MKNRNTQPEIRLRKCLWANGLRYRLHRSDLPGTPDIVFESARLAIFVNGCFWHSHDCVKRPSFQRNRGYWNEVLSANKVRDRYNVIALREIGYSVSTFWECEINRDSQICVDQIMGRLHFARRRLQGSQIICSDRLAPWRRRDAHLRVD